MKDQLIKNLHVFIFLYVAFVNFGIYEESTEKIEITKSTIASNESRLQRSKRELAKVDQFNKDLSSSQARVNAVVSEIKKVQKQLPSQINDTEVQGILFGISNDLRMKDPNMKPKQEVLKGFYYSKDFSFSVKTTFLQNLIFFEKLEELAKSDRILNVKYLKVSDDKDSDQRSQFRGLKLTAEVESYRYNDNYKIEELSQVDPLGGTKTQGEVNR